MAFSRALVPAASAGGDALTAAMVGIGMNFAVSGTRQPNIGLTGGAPNISGAPNIEDTLLFASIEGLEREKPDLRVLAILATWFGVHATWVNADRLTRLAGMNTSPRVRAFWSALASWQEQEKDRRFARLARLYAGPRQDLLETGTEFQIKRYGEDPRFAGSAIRVAANVLRDRTTDVLPPAALARRHPTYRWRVVIGPSYRADMWAVLEDDTTLSAAALARKTYGSFATAWRVRRDFGLLTKLPD
ncbi:MAG TPA: hypothetical protein VN176_15405 [Verrucomicrobiae bacterium]|jgi:hypothetical protein|nr:hypothetical protein [Verrucomicrobiae bacterium]